MRYRRPRQALIAVLAVMSLAGTSLALLPPGPASAAVAAVSARHDSSAFQLPKGVKRLCAAPKSHHRACDALVLTTKRRLVAPRATMMQPPYGPNALRAAYGLAYASANQGNNETVAIVDAYDYPNMETDLGVYRATYGLPPCTTGNGCFLKLNQFGSQSNLPGYDPGWGGEEMLDVEMVSAICPNCHIVVVEANSNADVDLSAAENAAKNVAGVKFISNSWGGSAPLAGNGPWDSHDGIVITASSGDSGYGISYPATYTHVVGVGGTSLLPASNARGWAEIAWTGGGSGCSTETKPPWQTDTGCPGKSMVDVSAVADPSTGVLMYDNDPNGPTMGWGQIGGTSASSPIIAAIYALAGDPPSGSDAGARVLYQHPGSMFHDIVSGTDSVSGCTPTYECTAGSGYDGPTGLGTPAGLYGWDCGAPIQGAGTDPSTQNYTQGPPVGCEADIPPGTGIVMKSVTVYLAFWLPPGTSFEGSGTDPNGDIAFEAQQERFIHDLSGSAYWNILSQYGVPDTVTLGGTAVDTTTPIPQVANSDGVMVMPQGTEGTEVQNIDKQQGWPEDLSHITLLITPYDIQSSLPSCGYHSVLSGAQAPFAWIPANDGCHLPPPSPGNRVADTTTGIIAHELAEAATDPLTNSYKIPSDYPTDSYANDEVGDACRGSFPTAPWNGAGDDVTMNGDHYLVQELWSNAEHTCDIGMVGGTTPPPSVSQTQTADNYNPGPGATTHITLTVMNTDPIGPATHVHLSEVLPSNLTITDVSAPYDESVSYQGSSFTVNYSALPIQQTMTITITAVSSAESLNTVCPVLTLDNLLGTSIAPASTQCIEVLPGNPGVG